MDIKTSWTASRILVNYGQICCATPLYRADPNCVEAREKRNNMLLVIDCCPRGDDSATRTYYQAYLRAADKQNIQIVELDKLGLMPLDGETLRKRDKLVSAQDFGSEQFFLARQFKEADEVLIAAPFWDLSFPSLLKVYLEHVTVNGLTFGYDEQGCCRGLCRARKLLYFSTCGGFYGDRHLGYEYVKALGNMLGIPLCVPYIIEGLDIDPNKRDSIVTQAINELLSNGEN